MIILDATTKSLTVAMSGAAATTNPDFVAAWSDDTGTSFTEGSTDGVLNGTSQVTLVAAPAASTRRIIKTVYIENKDTAAVTITVTYNNNSTLRTIAKVTLQVGDTWSTDGTTDSSGALKQTIGAINLATVTGTLATANGGTGSSSTTYASLTANVSGILPAANGGTANGFTAFSGPTTSTKTFTLPDATATILTSNTAVTVAQGGTGLTAGTSGGIPYFSSTSAITSSALLTQYGVVYGGGAGAAPVSTAAGTTGQVLTANTGAAPAWAAAAGATITGTTTSATYYVVGTTSTSGSLTTASISNTNAVSYNASTGALSAVSHVSSSDESLKTNWRDVKPDFIEQLAEVKSGIFDRIEGGNTEVGVSAQSLLNALEQAVITGEDGKLSVNYGGAALIACIQLSKRVLELEAKLDQLSKGNQ